MRTVFQSLIKVDEGSIKCPSKQIKSNFKVVYFEVYNTKIIFNLFILMLQYGNKWQDCEDSMRLWKDTTKLEMVAFKVHNCTLER